ncbi:MAG TPA: GNAT family N-acetyltransferase [Caulobacteraceae bacterium]|jgi:GNAT superfamily N-acetyltransferase
MTTLQATLRPAWGADLTGLGRIDPQLAQPAYGRKASRLLNQGRAWVADVGGAPVGYALTSLDFFTRPLVEMIFVAERYRRQGLGLALLMRCETAHQDDRMFVTIKVSDAPMLGLLTKAGFQGSGIVYNLSPDDPELVYVKLRAPPLTFVKYQPPA